jgi:pilus assembly protein CpaF
MSVNINWGPLQTLVFNENVSEIIVNSYCQIFFETEAVLHEHNEQFKNLDEYQILVEQITAAAQTFLNRDKPFLELQIRNHRITLIYSELAVHSTLLCMRRIGLGQSLLKDLLNNNWCNEQQLQLLHQSLLRRDNILVVGGTSSGKSTLLQTLLNSLPQNERVIIIEDTEELKPCNAVSAQLVCRQKINEQLGFIGYEDLIKHSLRLRPDRLVLGEIRSSEAYNFLLALSSGHSGSMGSMHAQNAREALLKLEMLVQLGAPQWSYQSIRRLISLSLQTILVVEKKNGQRRLKEIAHISSLEEHSITLEQAALN